MTLSKWVNEVRLGAFSGGGRDARDSARSPRVRHFCHCSLLFCGFIHPQSQFEDRPVSDVTVTFEGADRNIAINERFRVLARDAVGPNYSAVKVRDAIEKLYQTNQVASVSVEAADGASGGVNLRFIIKRKAQAQKVSVEIVGDDEAVTEQDLLLRLNLLEAGTAITEQTLKNNADVILEYLRDRGYFKAEVTYKQTPIENENEVGVTFRVTPNAQATVASFNINVAGFDNARLTDAIKLNPGEPFTRDQLNTDVEKVREVLRQESYLAPSLEEPRASFTTATRMRSQSILPGRSARKWTSRWFPNTTVPAKKPRPICCP